MALTLAAPNAGDSVTDFVFGACMQGKKQEHSVSVLERGDMFFFYRLDYPGAQMLLIGASGDVRGELGLDLDSERETERTAEIFRDLHLTKSQFKLAPLFKGKWE
jgi:hypothetical protein